MKIFKSKRYHIISIVLVLTIAIALLAACAQAPAPAPAAPAAPAAPSAPAAPAPATAPKPGQAPAATPAPSGKPLMLTISGGTIGGGSNLNANVLAAVAKKFLGLDSTTIINPSMGQTHVVVEGRADIATSPGFLPKQALDGTGPWADTGPNPNIRVLHINTSAIVQGFILEGSGPVNWADLDGKRISTGKVGFHSDWAAGLIMEILGITPSSWEHTGHSESAAALVLGKLDAYFASAAPPHPTLAQTDLTNPVDLLTFSDEELAKVRASTSFQPITIAAGTYRGMAVDRILIEDPWTYVTTTALSEDIAYGLVKSCLDNPDFIGTIYASPMNDILDGKVKTWTAEVITAPYHIGAYKALIEAGYSVPDAMIPPEAK